MPFIAHNLHSMLKDESLQTFHEICEAHEGRPCTAQLNMALEFQHPLNAWATAAYSFPDGSVLATNTDAGGYLTENLKAHDPGWAHSLVGALNQFHQEESFSDGRPPKAGAGLIVAICNDN